MSPVSVAFLCALACLTGPARAQAALALVEESLKRHAAPAYVYEEHALVMTDRLGQYTLRTAHYYGQHEESRTRKLYIIESPAELKGAALQIDRDLSAGTRRGPTPSIPAFGTNFLAADLDDEQVSDFRYEHDSERDLERVPHYVVRAVPADASVIRATGYHQRRIYLRKDNLFISRIDYQDRDGRPARRLSFRDPRPDEFGIWRASMMLMEDLRDGRRTLLKVERRVHSADYVPPGVFEGLQARR
jgi:hypothetical protein